MERVKENGWADKIDYDHDSVSENNQSSRQMIYYEELEDPLALDFATKHKTYVDDYQNIIRYDH